MVGLVYTAVIGEYDNPRPNKVNNTGVEFWMVGAGERTPPNWTSVPIYTASRVPLALARQVKILAPLMYPDFDWYLWMDGTMQLKKSPLSWIKDLIEKGADMAAFKHNEWDCAYDEIRACAERRKAKICDLAVTKTFLERQRHPKKWGQIATGFLWRYRTDMVVEHAMRWYEAVRKTTWRDQCTVMTTARRCGLEISYLPGLHTKNDLVDYRRGHLK